MGGIEREAKLTLSFHDYEGLKETGHVLECTDQLNVYLHDPDRLEEGLGYLRVRYEGGREPLATLKVPRRWEGGFREMLEIERPLKEMGPGLHPWPRRRVQVTSDLPDEMRRHFLDQGIQVVHRLGWMRNLRCVVEMEGLGAVELDRTRLPGGRFHHEVEIESRDVEGSARLVERVLEVAPSAAPSRVGKFSLFLEAAGIVPPYPFV